LPWLPPVDVAPENVDEESPRDFDNRYDTDNNNTRVMWMRGAARIQKQVVYYTTIKTVPNGSRRYALDYIVAE